MPETVCNELPPIHVETLIGCWEGRTALFSRSCPQADFQMSSEIGSKMHYSQLQTHHLQGGVISEKFVSFPHSN